MLEAKAIGRLVADPRIREVTKNETVYKVCEFRLACQQKKDKVDYINATAWRGMGDFIFKNVHKGQKIYISGTLKVPPYDKEKGRAYDPYIIVYNFEFCDNKTKPTQPEPENKAVSASDEELVETLSEDEVFQIT
ncbi:MAG TPA: single-stranded DNA-binding protein [Caproicibacter sp.]|nr:single-stranded DNA-binding protein [Caproicibacter sp.]